MLQVYLLLGSLNSYLRSQSQQELEKLVHDLAALLVLLGVGAQVGADLPASSMMEMISKTNSGATKPRAALCADSVDA